jgi:hypothetical protein
MRNSKKIDLNWFYEYYVEHSKHQIPFQEFYQIVQFVDFNQIMKHIDLKFNLTILEDQHGGFVKVIE